MQNMCQQLPQPPRQKVPNDGMGPRGVPDCYYTSRQLDSTFRYVRFVKKLRAEEEETRKGAEIKLKELKDKQTSDFFISCDRRSLINNVARRVDLCMSSYEQNLQEKRARLKQQLQHEEEENTRKFVAQAQAGAEAVWQDKMERLAYLIAKRKKENEDKYKDTPLSKCAHVLPCIYQLRAKETEEIQLYQMREKQARKMSEIEFDKMWHEIAMKESDALAARMELDAMQRKRKDLECKEYADYQLEERKRQKELERERLKQETLYFRSMWEEDLKKEEEAEQERKEKRLDAGRQRKQMIEERDQKMAEKAEADRTINDTWSSLAGQGLAAEKAHIEMLRQKERDLDECNRKMIELREGIRKLDSASDYVITEELKKQQEVVDKKRCVYKLWSQKTNRDCRLAMQEQIKDRAAARAELKRKLAEQDEYQRQVSRQIEELCRHKELTDAQARKKYQQDLLKQIEYNKLLKERALQEEMDQRKKAQLASEEYDREIGKMLCRPFFSDEVHPFTRQVAKNWKLCPCSERQHCKKHTE